jgi:hypothetical protein
VAAGSGWRLEVASGWCRVASACGALAQADAGMTHHVDGGGPEGTDGAEGNGDAEGGGGGGLLAVCRKWFEVGSGDDY